MGFFSWNCKCCGKSIRSGYSTCKMDEWMKRVVFLMPGGSIHIGEYGGYGDVDGHEIDHWNGVAAYHEKCWKEAGKPDYDGNSDDANDQGYFCEVDKSLCVKCDNSKCECHADYQSKKCSHCEREQQIESLMPLAEVPECPKCGHCDWCCECGWMGEDLEEANV